jgi:hypothetical protein
VVTSNVGDQRPRKQRAEARYEGRCIGWLGVRFKARRSVSRDTGRVSIVNLRPRNGVSCENMSICLTRFDDGSPIW